MARLFARIAALVLGVSFFSAAHAQTYTYSFYLGNKLIPGGCSVSTPAGTVNNVRWRLQATVTAGVTPTFSNVRQSTCAAGFYTPALPVLSTSAIGLNTGSGGADVIEVRLPLVTVTPEPGIREVLAVVASSPTASDALIATQISGVAASKGGPPPSPPIAPIVVPTLGAGTIALLGLLLLGIGWLVLRRHRHLLLFSLLLVAGTAWAVAIVIDGQVGDWATVPSSTDATGDVAAPGLDLVKLYVTAHGLHSYLRVDVKNLQNPPVANPGSATLLEDASTTITLTGSDPGSSPLTFQIASAPARGTLGPVTPINATSASVQYTGNLDEFGSDSFTFTTNNGSQTSTPATVSVTLTPVNDAPSFTAANPPTANEGGGAQSVPGWATFDSGPNNESTQAVQQYLVSAIGNPSLFSVAPTVAANGTLSYTPAANANGSSTFSVAVSDNGGTANGGVDTSPTQTFTITVGAVNAAPNFVGGGNVSALEDAGAQTAAGWASAMADGDPEVAQTLTFNITGNTNPALFSAAPSVDAVSGNLSYTPAPDANGSAQITLTLSDDGGTANGGSNTSAPYVFTVQVTPVNDAPSFSAVDPPAVNENSGAQSVPGWASFTAGPADESSQAALQYLVSAIGTPSLFAVAPTVAPDGTLTYTVAPGVSGTSTVSIAVRDDGGTANGGVDLGASQVFTITVNAVNSAPTFTGGGSVSSSEDGGAQVFPAWATAIDDGDSDQVQALTFNVTGNTNPTLFMAGPSVDPISGELSYSAAANASGSATITLTLSDDGGTANGGSDTSVPYVFTITVDPSNDAPTATPKSHVTHSAIELEIIAASHTGELLEGATDSDDPSGDLTAEYIAGSATPTGAQVTVTNASDGSFRYDPPGGYSGAGSFQYRVCDDGVPVAPPQCSAATTVSFDITGPELYFVDDSAAGGGDGGLNDPFVSLADLPPGRGTGDRIYLHSGSYASAHALHAGEHLIGQGHGGSSAAHLGVVAVANGVLDGTPASGAAPTIANTISFGGDDGLLRGVAVDAGANTGVSAGAVSGITVTESSVQSSTTAANFNGTDASAAGVVFTSTTSSGGTNGIVLNNVTDTFDFGTGALSGHTGVSFLGTGTLGTTSYAGTISKNAAGNIIELTGASPGTATLSGNLTCNGACAGIDVLNRGAGTITFSGTNKSLSTAANTAVNLDNNDSTAIHFTGGGLDIDTTSGVGFNAVAGATAVTVQGAGNTIDSVSGVALRVASTAIGAPDVTFERISSGGGPNVGIHLDGTGTEGSLVVTGNGAAGSGGTIANKTGPDGSTGAGIGVYLNATSGASLSSMQMNDFDNFAIRAVGIDGFTLADSVINALDGTPMNGTAQGEGGVGEGSIRFENVVGAVSIANSTITHGIYDNVGIFNDNTSATLNLAVSNTTFATSTAVGTGNDALRVEIEDSVAGAPQAHATILINGDSDFTAARGDLIDVLGQRTPLATSAAVPGNAAIVDVTIEGNDFSNNHPSIAGGGGGVIVHGQGNVAFTIQDNDARDARGRALTISKGASRGVYSGRLHDNRIGVTGVATSGSAESSGLFVDGGGQNSMTLAVTSNTVRQTNEAGIYVVANNQAIALNHATLHATVTGNVVAEPGLDFTFAGLFVDVGTGVLGDSTTACVDVGGAGALQNDFSAGDPFNGGDINLSTNTTTATRLPGYAGGATDTTAVATYLDNRNANAAATTETVFAGGAGYVGGAACTQPP